MIPEELRLATRALMRSPGFTVVAALTLVLGVGANVAIFAVVNRALGPLPYAAPDRLVRLWSNLPERNLEFFSTSPRDYLEWRVRNRSFEAMGAYEREAPAALTGMGDPQEIQRSRIAADLVPLLGIQPMFGRTFTADEANAEERLALVAESFWRTQLGGTPDALGRSIVLDGEPYTVIGVMPASFALPVNASTIWTPLRLVPDPEGGRFLRVLARLRPGITPEAAIRDMQRVTAELAAEFPEQNANWTITLRRLDENVLGENFRPAIRILAGVVALVLLIACANVSNLMLARLARRRQEVAVRGALGASRRRLAGQWLAEGAMLGMMAAPAGALLGLWGVALLRALGSDQVPRVAGIRMGGDEVLFAIVLSLGAGLVLSVLPGAIAALSGRRAHIGDTARVHGGRGAERLRGVLVTSQVAVAAVLLVGAALMLQSFRRLQSLDMGFDAQGISYAIVSLPDARYPEPARVPFFAGLLERVRGIPGIESAAAVSSAPFAGPNSATVILPEHETAQYGEAPDADYRVVTADYFETLRIPLLRGRGFRAGDNEKTLEAVISRTMAEQFWPDGDAVGRRFRIMDPVNGPFVTVLGIVEDVRHYDLSGDPLRPMMYLHHAFNAPAPRMTLLVRTRGGAGDVGRAIRAEVAALDPLLPVSTQGSYEELVGDAFGQPRFRATLFGTFAALALILSGVGLYAVIAYAVAQRTRELGVRMALGARVAQVVRMVMARGLTLASAGLAIGLLGGYAGSRLIESMLFRTERADAAALAAVAVALLAVAAMACLVPARRAARLEPARALRD